MALQNLSYGCLGKLFASSHLRETSMFTIRLRLVSIVCLLFVGVSAATLVAGQSPANTNPSDSEAANKSAAVVDDAAVKTAATQAATRLAVKTAEDEANDRAAKKKEFEALPLVVACITPYVDAREKGTCDPGNPRNSIPGKAGMGDVISVAIPRLLEAAKYEVVDPAKLVLFIDGRVFPGVTPQVNSDSLIFKLKRTTDAPEAIDAWNGLLGSPGIEPTKPVVVSVGYPGQSPLGLAKDFPQKHNLNLIVYRRGWALITLLALLAMALAFWKLGGVNLLRDSGPPNPEPGKRPFSLARVQVAWWFLLVVGCFLLIYMITGEFTMTEQALILIGIGTGTALGSAMIENSKRGGADSDLGVLKPQYATLAAEVAQLEADRTALETEIAANPGSTDAEKLTRKADQGSLNAKKIELAGKGEQLEALKRKIDEATSGLTKPVSVTFWDDLVTDANGPSFHRFQMIAWTLILGGLFLVGVYKDLAMPQFSGTMLALMGISAGTYLGFKIPEKQNVADTPGSAAGAATGTTEQNAATAKASEEAAAAAAKAAEDEAAAKAAEEEAAAAKAAEEEAAAKAAEEEAAAAKAAEEEAAAAKTAEEEAAAAKAAEDETAADDDG
jgi:hypothetical protein